MSDVSLHSNTDFLVCFHNRMERIKLVEKTESVFMKMLDVGLSITNFLHITDIKKFLTSYGTTIGHTIYDHPKWEWNRECGTHVVHELTHVMEWGFSYIFRYLFSPQWRAYYESVCIQTEWLIFPETKTQEEIVRRAKKLESYGIGFGESLRMLNDRVKEIDDGEPKEEALWMKQFYDEWKNERGF